MLRLDLVALRVCEVHGGDDLLVGNNLVVFPGVPELLSVRRSHAAEELSSYTKIHLADRSSKALRPPPLHHVLRIGPRVPDQFAWGIEHSCDRHPPFFANYASS